MKCLITLFLLTHFISLPSQGVVSHIDSIYNPANDKNVFVNYRRDPSFPYGNVQYYIRKSLRYPQDALDQEIHGKVYVQFLITEKGNITDVKIIRGVHPSIDAEALRVVKELPPFRPAEEEGKPIQIFYTLPVIFRLDKINEQLRTTDYAFSSKAYKPDYTQIIELNQQKFNNIPHHYLYNNMIANTIEHYLQKYISLSYRFKSGNRELEIKKYIEIKVIIDTAGYLEQVYLHNPSHPEFTQEVIHVIKKIPRLVPSYDRKKIMEFFEDYIYHFSIQCWKEKRETSSE